MRVASGGPVSVSVVVGFRLASRGLPAVALVAALPMICTLRAGRRHTGQPGGHLCDCLRIKDKGPAAGGRKGLLKILASLVALIWAVKGPPETQGSWGPDVGMVISECGTRRARLSLWWGCDCGCNRVQLRAGAARPKFRYLWAGAAGDLSARGARSAVECTWEWLFGPNNHSHVHSVLIGLCHCPWLSGIG